MTSATSRRLAGGRRSSGGLSKAEVASNQRARILFAMAEAVADEGYAGVAVADVIARAGVSRATFYEQFADKLDCFLAAFDAAVELMFGSVRQHVPVDAVPGSFDAVLAAYLDTLVANEAFARVFLIDVYAAGPEAFARRAASQQRFADVIAAIFGATTSERRFACDAFVAATASMVTSRLAARDLDGLRELRVPLGKLALRLLGASNA